MNEVERLLREQIEILKQQQTQPPRPVVYGETIEPSFALQVLAGKVLNWRAVHKFGRNPDADDALEDVWDGASLWVPPTTARTHTLVSTDVKDNGVIAGVGARTLRIYGLDGNLNLIQEDVPLNGVAGVTTRREFQMIHRMKITTVGSEADNAGTITATAATDGTVTAQIQPGNNQTLMAIYQIPGGHRAYLLELWWSLNKTGGAAKFADMTLRSSPLGFPGFLVKHVQALGSDGTGAYAQPLSVPGIFEGGTIVKVSCLASAVDQDISAGFGLLLEDCRVN